MEGNNPALFSFKNKKKRDQKAKCNFLLIFIKEVEKYFSQRLKGDFKKKKRKEENNKYLKIRKIKILKSFNPNDNSWI